MRGNRCWTAMLLGWLWAAPAVAAEPTARAADPPSTMTGSEANQAATSSADAVPAGEPLRTLDVIQALRPEVDWTPDPFARRPNRFDGRFGRSPSPEEISLQHGGYLMYGISKALSKGGRWLNRATGGPDQIQHAQARDVPLDDEQIARAARWSAQQGAEARPSDGD